MLANNPFMPSLETLLNKYFKVSKPSEKNPQSNFAVLPTVRLAEQLREVAEVDNLYTAPDGAKYYFQIHLGEATNRNTGEVFTSKLIFFNPAVKSQTETAQTAETSQAIEPVEPAADVPF